MDQQTIESKIKEIEQKLLSPSFLSNSPSIELTNLLSRYNDLNIRLNNLSIKQRAGTYMDGYRFLT